MKAVGNATIRELFEELRLKDSATNDFNKNLAAGRECTKQSNHTVYVDDVIDRAKVGNACGGALKVQGTGWFELMPHEIECLDMNLRM